MSLLRNLTRRKLRTALTVIGIAVGIWALVVMAALATKLSALVEGGSTYFRDKVVVTDAANNPFFQATLTLPPLTIDIVQQIEQLPGVAVAVPRVLLPMNPDGPGNAFQTPAYIVGYTAGADRGHETFPLRIAKGRATAVRDEGHQVVFLGADLAREFDKRPGDTFQIRGIEFEVVGVGEPRLMFFDSSAVIPLAEAQVMLSREAPIVAGRGLDAGPIDVHGGGLSGGWGGHWLAGAEDRTEDPEVRAGTSTDYDDEFGSTLAILTPSSSVWR